MYQPSSVTQLCATLRDPIVCSASGTFSSTNSQSLFKLMSIKVGDAIQPHHPLSFLSPLAFNLSQHQGLFKMSQFFTSGGQSIGASASASVLPMNSQDWWDWLVGSPWSLRDSQESFPTSQFKNINSWGPTFFTVHLSYPFMTTGKTIALTIWIFVGKVIVLLYKMLTERLVIAFLPRSQHL